MSNAKEKWLSGELGRLLREIAGAGAERDLAIEQRNMGAEIIEGNCKIIDALKAERDEYVQMWRAGCDDRAALSKEVEELRTALEEISSKYAGPEATKARRALEGK